MGEGDLGDGGWLVSGTVRVSSCEGGRLSGTVLSGAVEVRSWERAWWLVVSGIVDCEAGRGYGIVGGESGGVSALVVWVDGEQGVS